MTNAELFMKAMVAGAGFSMGVAIMVGACLIFAIIIGCIASDNKT